MKRFVTYLLSLGLSGLLTGSPLFAQTGSQAALPDSTDSKDWNYVPETGNFPKQAYEALKQFNVSGYYRFVANYRHLEEAYPHLANNVNNLFVGDDSQIPQLMLNLSGSVARNTSFGTDLYLWTPMTGAGSQENVKGLNLGISLYGTYSSPFGDFMVRTGGINWYSLTPFTFQSNKGYDRYSIFERNPWDPNTKSLDTRYSLFYNSGAINQDERWGQQAFQGLIVEGDKIPGGFSGALMYGKTQLNGGLSPLPNSSFGGRIKKGTVSNYISFNTFNNATYTDSTQRRSMGFHVHTIEFRTRLGRFLLKGETGAGRTFVQDDPNDWGEAISLKIATDVAGKFPTELHVYRISPDVINNSSAFMNSSFEQVVTGENTTQPVLPSVATAMVPIGQLTNNRQGIDINSQVNIGRMKASLGYSNAVELDKLSSKITYGHPVNNIALSHFWRWDFPSNVGPYNNLSKIYRLVYETVNLTDLDTLTHRPLRLKYLNSLEANIKYKGQIAGRDYYLYYLGHYSSVQYFLAPVTVFTEKALLRTYYHQLEAYYRISPAFIWANYVGFERIIANYHTETDVVSRRPKNQTGFSLATGFDILMSKGAGLYLRQRWMNYQDKSFENDKYRGFETTVEIKIFF